MHSVLSTLSVFNFTKTLFIPLLWDECVHPVCSVGPYDTNESGLSSEGCCPCLICCQCCKELINGVGDRRKRNEGLMVKTIECYSGELDSIPISAIKLQCDAGQTFHRWLLIVSFSFSACIVGNTWGQIYRSAKHSNCNRIWLKRFSEWNHCWYFWKFRSCLFKQMFAWQFWSSPEESIEIRQ